MNSYLSSRHPAAIVIAPVLMIAVLLVAALFVGCGGQWVEPNEEFITEGMDQVCWDWQRTALFDGPVCIKDQELWNAVQEKMGKQLGAVNFDAFMVVGHFALEPDTPAMVSGTGKAEDRGYGVKIKSIRKKGSDVLTVRLKVVTATRTDEAEGPLHYALAVVPRHNGTVMFYVNGREYEYSTTAAFLKKNPQSFTDQLLGKDPNK